GGRGGRGGASAPPSGGRRGGGAQGPRAPRRGWGPPRPTPRRQTSRAQTPPGRPPRTRCHRRRPPSAPKARRPALRSRVATPSAPCSRHPPSRSAVLSHSALTPVHVVLHKLQKRIAIVFAILGDWAAFIGALLILGLGTSWYMIGVGTPLTTVQQGPWVGWTSGGRADADPYTRAHFARLGSLQLSAENLLTYVAHTDSDGRRLHSSCDYSVEGRE